MKSYRIFSFTTSLIIIVAVIWYVTTNWSSFSEVSIVQPLYLLPAGLFTTINVFFLGRILDSVLSHRKISLSPTETFGLSAITRFGNYISTGYLGTSIRAIYLKKTYSLPYSNFSGGFVFSNLVQLSVTGVLGTLIILTLFYEQTPIGSLFFMFVLMLGFLGILLSPTGTLTRLRDKINTNPNKKPLHLLSKALTEFINLKKHPSSIIYLILWTLCAIVASAFSLQFFFRALGYTIAIQQVLFISIAAGWALIVSITPANIGVSEGFLALGAKIVGVPVPQALAVAILQRIINFLILGALSLIFTRVLFKRSFFQLQRLKERTEDEKN